MAWFKVDDGLHSSRKMMSIPKRGRWAAIGLWTVAGSWCADQLTDGYVPDYMLTEWGSPPSAPDALVDSGLWERESGGYLFCNWHEYQPSKQDVDSERAASRARMKELRARRKQPKPQNDGADGGVFGRTDPNGSENVRNPDPTRPDPTHIEVPKGTSSSEVADAPIRPDVLHLIEVMEEELKKNGSKIPTRTKKNTDAARLMLDRDKYTVEQVEAAIRWSQGDEFWRSNILSMSKLRAKYEQLRLAAQRSPKPGSAQKPTKPKQIFNDLDY